MTEYEVGVPVLEIEKAGVIVSSRIAAAPPFIAFTTMSRVGALHDRMRAKQGRRLNVWALESRDDWERCGSRLKSVTTTDTL